jgi:hypothetical protein
MDEQGAAAAFGPRYPSYMIRSIATGSPTGFARWRRVQGSNLCVPKDSTR